MAAFEGADRAFATAHDIAPLGEHDQAAWARMLFNWGYQLSQLVGLSSDDRVVNLGRACASIAKIGAMPKAGGQTRHGTENRATGGIINSP